MFPILETDEIILREISESDAADLFEYFSKDKVMAHYGQEAFQGIDDIHRLVALCRNNFEGKTGIRWGIEHRQEKRLIGTVGFNAWSPKHKRAEIGYELNPIYWRKGISTQAVIRVISYGFEKMNLNRIGAIVYLENLASQNLLGKIGFCKEGILRDYMYSYGGSHDVYMYSLLKEEWIRYI